MFTETLSRYMLRSFGDYRAFLNNKIVLLIVAKLLAQPIRCYWPHDRRKTRNMQRDKISINMNIARSYD
jgi:hypothetical protein